MGILIKALEWYFCSLPISLAALGLLSAAQATIRWANRNVFSALRIAPNLTDVCAETPII